MIGQALMFYFGKTQIMNHYMQLIMDRADKFPDKYPSVFAFNTFFFGKLKKEGYASVRRWTKKVFIFCSAFFVSNVVERSLILATLTHLFFANGTD